MKRTLVTLALVVVFVLALAAPAFAMYHTATYKLDGVIDFKSQAGHECNTGGVMKQVISGSGTMDKVMTLTIKPGVLTVSDHNDFVAGATPLTVTSVWELCTPPKFTYNVEFNDSDYDIPVGLRAIYGDYDIPSGWGFLGLLGDPPNPWTGATTEMLAEWYGWDALTSQIWAVQVQADPGFSGSLHQDGEAAYGKYWSEEVDYDASWYSGPLNYDDRWRWEQTEEGGSVYAPSVGKNFVGDYFVMEQHARTSQGTLRRFIDISSPWSHAYLMEDMSIVGKSDVKDAFELHNAPKGADIIGTWWDLF